MTVSEYFFLCKKAGLTLFEMEEMTIGMCLDHIEEYFISKNPELLKPNKASQYDIDKLKGR